MEEDSKVVVVEHSIFEFLKEKIESTGELFEMRRGWTGFAQN